VRPTRAAVLLASSLAVALTAHTAWNARQLRRAPRPDPTGTAARTRVSVLLPARDEAHRIAPCLAGLLAQDHPRLRVLILDDGSTDGTGALVRAQVGHDPRFEVLDGGGEGPPAGWLGKPWACDRLARAALAEDDRPDLLVLVDADVVLAAGAIGRIAALVQDSGLDLASPYPRQQALTLAERIVQPLLQWSWLTTLPLPLAERSSRPSLTAANGQVLAVRPHALERIGGYASVRSEVLEDIALARRVKASGGRATVTDGTDLATCRMYTSGRELVDGYTKSLWAAFGSAPGSLGATALLTFVYVLPPAAACAPGSARTGGRPGDAWAHPLSILALDGLTALSWYRHRRGQLAWKGRPVLPGARA
jgi:cellulose synthase/poly-beta-1,6-N-acetylglucosamine synthase-like glycosyltransferase